MRKLKLVLTLSILLIFIIAGVVIFKSNEGPEIAKFDESKADALEIENVKITNISNSKTKKEVTTKVTNKIDETISKINIRYNELDEKENKINSNNTSIDVSLNKDEKALVSIKPQNYTNTIDIVGYNYNTEKYSVDVSLENDDILVKSINKDEEDENSEVLSFSDLEKEESTDSNVYVLKIKNLSKKNLGNIILRVAELNEDGEYVSVNNIPYNNILKEKEEIEITLNAGAGNKLEITGYTYDDMEKKEKVDIDLKSHSQNVVKSE